MKWELEGRSERCRENFTFLQGFRAFPAPSFHKLNMEIKTAELLKLRLQTGAAEF
jgi:hypothetical protein